MLGQDSNSLVLTLFVIKELSNLMSNELFLFKLYIFGKCYINFI